jgi:hypothetical protein
MATGGASPSGSSIREDGLEAVDRFALKVQ